MLILMDKKYRKIIVDKDNDDNDIETIIRVRKDMSVNIEVASCHNGERHYIGYINTIMMDAGENKLMYIEDIRVSILNNGFGSILLKKLIEYCKDIDIDFIGGHISKFDYNNNPERLIKFFTKNNFTVFMNSSIDKENDIYNGIILYNVKGE